MRCAVSKTNVNSKHKWIQIFYSILWNISREAETHHLCEWAHNLLNPNNNYSNISTYTWMNCLKHTFWEKKTTPNCCFVSSQKQGGICGPWIPDDGKIVTHTVSKAGKMTQKYWTSKVSQHKRNSSKEWEISNICWCLEDICYIFIQPHIMLIPENI